MSFPVLYNQYFTVATADDLATRVTRSQSSLVASARRRLLSGVEVPRYAGPRGMVVPCVRVTLQQVSRTRQTPPVSLSALLIVAQSILNHPDGRRPCHYRRVPAAWLGRAYASPVVCVGEVSGLDEPSRCCGCSDGGPALPRGPAMPLPRLPTYGVSSQPHALSIVFLHHRPHLRPPAMHVAILLFSR
jgi:hypothetical protein